MALVKSNGAKQQLKKKLREQGYFAFTKKMG